jgi:hypothetical protein
MALAMGMGLFDVREKEKLPQAPERRACIHRGVAVCVWCGVVVLCRSRKWHVILVFILFACFEADLSRDS